MTQSAPSTVIHIGAVVFASCVAMSACVVDTIDTSARNSESWDATYARYANLDNPEQRMSGAAKRGLFELYGQLFNENNNFNNRNINQWVLDEVWQDGEPAYKYIARAIGNGALGFTDVFDYNGLDMNGARTVENPEAFKDVIRDVQLPRGELAVSP